jgi:hypothetical protein
VNCRSNNAARNAGVAGIDMKLEVVVIPVSDVERSKEFYERIGWRLDIDRSAGEDFRLVPTRRASVAAAAWIRSACPCSRACGDEPSRGILHCQAWSYSSVTEIREHARQRVPPHRIHVGFQRLAVVRRSPTHAQSAAFDPKRSLDLKTNWSIYRQ